MKEKATYSKHKEMRTFYTESYGKQSLVGPHFYQIAVGMLVAQHPPLRSQRAELPHWAPALDKDAQSLLWIGMLDFGIREPTFDNTFHSLPVDSGPLAPPAELPKPEPANKVSEGVHGATISRDTIVIIVTP